MICCIIYWSFGEIMSNEKSVEKVPLWQKPFDVVIFILTVIAIIVAFLPVFENQPQFQFEYVNNTVHNLTLNKLMFITWGIGI